MAIETTDILSNGRNQHNRDPEVGYGYKTDKERFHGYWLLSVTGTISEMTRAVRVSPANVHQSVTAQQLFDDLSIKNLRRATIIMVDSAYDDKKTYHRSIELDLVSLISYNPRKSKTKAFDELPLSNWRK